MEDKVRNLADNQDVRMVRSYFTFNMVEDPAKKFMTYSKDAFQKHRNQMLREKLEEGAESKMLRTAPALYYPTRSTMPKGFPGVSVNELL